MKPLAISLMRQAICISDQVMFCFYYHLRSEIRDDNQYFSRCQLGHRTDTLEERQRGNREDSHNNNSLNIQTGHILRLSTFPHSPCESDLDLRLFSAEGKYQTGKKVVFFSTHRGVQCPCPPTLRLVLDRGCAGSVNLQPSVPGVSTLACGSGISRDAPPDEGNIPKERGRSLLQREEGTGEISFSQWLMLKFSAVLNIIYIILPDSTACTRLWSLINLLHFNPLYVLHIIMDHLQESQQKNPKEKPVMKVIIDYNCTTCLSFFPSSPTHLWVSLMEGVVFLLELQLSFL